MRRFGDIWARPIPAEQGLVVFAMVAVLLITTAAVLMAIPSPDPDQPRSGAGRVETVAAKPSRDDQLERAAELTARRFMVGYLDLASGRASLDQVNSASPALIARLGRQMRVSPAARHEKQRLFEVQAGQISTRGGVVTATVEAGRIAYPVILEVALVRGRWLVERVGAE